MSKAIKQYNWDQERRLAQKFIIWCLEDPHGRSELTHLYQELETENYVSVLKRMRLTPLEQSKQKPVIQIVNNKLMKILAGIKGYVQEFDELTNLSDLEKIEDEPNNHLNAAIHLLVNLTKEPKDFWKLVIDGLVRRGW